MRVIKGKDRTETVKDTKKTEAPPTTPEPSAKMTICKVCGKEFEQTGKGRPAVNCPECREALKHEYKMPSKVKPTEPKPKGKPTVSVATDEDKAKQYGKIEPKPVVTDTASTGVSVADGKPTDTMNDAVHHPSHYTLLGLTVESVDVIRAVLTTEEFKGWCKGNALKYSLRAGRKDPTKEVQDLAKAGVFLSWITGE
jgi:DNA-directed RNA polymerase subunit RPC12/RpoP